MSTNDATPAVAAQLARVGLRGDAGHTETVEGREGLTLAPRDGLTSAQLGMLRRGLDNSRIAGYEDGLIEADDFDITPDLDRLAAAVGAWLADLRADLARVTAERDQARNERDAARMAGS